MYATSPGDFDRLGLIPLTVDGRAPEPDQNVTGPSLIANRLPLISQHSRIGRTVACGVYLKD